MGGLTSPATDTWLRELCAPYGTVTSAYVIRSKLTGQPFGYGFVEMRSREEAEEVIMALNGTRLEGQRLDVFLCREARYGEPGQRISGALDSDCLLYTSPSPRD